MLKLKLLSLLILMYCMEVESLQPYKFYEDGPCSRIRYNPLPNLNREFLDSLKYLQNGNRYHIYKQASHYTHYDSLLEDDLMYEFCYERNMTTLLTPTPAIGSVLGFGRRVIFTFRVKPPQDNRSDLYFEATPRERDSWDVARHFITLTDNQNFAIEVTCWTGSNQAGWALFTRDKFIDEGIRRYAQDHAAHMGFDSRNFVHLHHENCGMEQQQRNYLRYEAGDGYNYMRSNSRPDTRVGVPFQGLWDSGAMAEEAE